MQRNTITCMIILHVHFCDKALSINISRPMTLAMTLNLCLKALFFILLVVVAVDRRFKKHILFCLYNIGSEMSCVFYIPEPLARGYKTPNELHKYFMK